MINSTLPKNLLKSQQQQMENNLYADYKCLKKFQQFGKHAQERFNEICRPTYEVTTQAEEQIQFVAPLLKS